MDTILQDCLGIEYSGSDVQVMTEHAYLGFYRGDGVLKTYDHLKDKSSGVQTRQKEVKRAEARAQIVIDQKASKWGVNKKASNQVVKKNGNKCSAAASTSTNTAAEDAAIPHYGSDDAPDLAPPPLIILQLSRSHTILGYACNIVEVSAKCKTQHKTKGRECIWRKLQM